MQVCFPFSNTTATLIASFQNCYETRGPDDTVCENSSQQNPPGGSPCPKWGENPRLHPLGEDRPGLRAARAGEENRQIAPGSLWERRFNGSPIGKKNRNFTLKSLDNTPNQTSKGGG